MAISFSCPGCQATYQAEEVHAGKATSCPKCKTVITIPAIPVDTLGDLDTIPLADDPFAADSSPAQPTVVSRPLPSPQPQPAAAKRCPNCQAELAAGAVLCVACGFHLQQGQNVAATEPAQKKKRKKKKKQAEGWFEDMEESEVLKVIAIAGCLGVIVLTAGILVVFSPTMGGTSYKTGGTECYYWGWGTPIVATLLSTVVFCVGFMMSRSDHYLIRGRGYLFMVFAFLCPFTIAPSFLFSHVTVDDEYLIVNDGMFWFWRDMHTIPFDDVAEVRHSTTTDREGKTDHYLVYTLKDGYRDRIHVTWMMKEAMPRIERELEERQVEMK